MGDREPDQALGVCEQPDGLVNPDTTEDDLVRADQSVLRRDTAGCENRQKTDEYAVYPFIDQKPMSAHTR